MILQKYPSRLEFTFLFLTALIPIANWLWHISEYPFFHDQIRPFAFVYLIKEAFSHGNYAFSWLPNINGGYGYPMFVFYPIIFFYNSAILSTVLHINEFHAVMLMVYIISLVAIINLYYLLTELVVEKLYIWIGIILYIMIPYHYALLYIRGDYSEFLALSMLPMLVNMLMKHYIYEKNKFFIGLVIVLCIGIISHPIFITIFIPVCLIFVVYLLICEDVKFSILLSFLIALGISLIITSYYWLNFVLLIPEINLKQAVIDFPAFTQVKNSMELVNLIRSPFNYFQIGFLYLFLTVITLIQWNNIKHWIFGLGMLVWIMTLTTEFNTIFNIWTLPIISNIQFPWRMLGIINFILVLYITNIRLGKKMELWANLLIFSTLLISIQSTNFLAAWKPINQAEIRNMIQVAENSTNSGYGSLRSLSNEYASKNFLKMSSVSTQKVESLFNHTQITPITEYMQEMHYSLYVKKEDWIKINRMQLSNWIISINGNTITPETNNGIYLTKVPVGQHILSVKYQKPFSLDMYITTLLSLFVVIGLSYYVSKLNKK